MPILSVPPLLLLLHDIRRWHAHIKNPEAVNEGAWGVSLCAFS
jgi:hypothetical protein